MKKIVIISYYSKPSNFVGAERIKGWLDNLPKIDIYPILITRFWEKNQNTNANINLATKNIIENYENHEIHRVYSKETLRDSLIANNKFIFIRKTLSFAQIIFDNLIFKKSKYYNFFSYTDQFLKENGDCKTLIISGTPFHLFALGYYLKIKYPHINWFPDYRDQWTTHPFKLKLNFINNIIFWIERKNELKWTSNCKSFITVSENWKERIAAEIGKPGFVIKNGFNINTNQIIEQDVPRKKDELVISYVGSMYPYQDYKKLLGVIECLYKTKKIKIKINLVGVDAYHNISSEIKRLSHSYSELITISERIPSNQLEHIYAQSDLLWLTSFGNMGGWYPVKLFDYASQGIPILLYPSDNDVIQKFILETQTGYTFNKMSKLKKWLESIYKGHSQIKLTVDKNELRKYSREYQSKKLIDVLMPKK